MSQRQTATRFVTNPPQGIADSQETSYEHPHYGRHIVNLFARYYWPILLVLIAFSVLGALYGLSEYKRGQKTNASETLRPGSEPRPRPA
jgi:hypothetical protein